MKWVAALAILTALLIGYGGAKTIADIRAKRWLWSTVGGIVTIGAATVLAIFAQLLLDYLG